VGVQPGHSPEAVADDPLPEAVALAEAAANAGVGLKLLGGLAVRVLRLPVEGTQGHGGVP
jgi:hypothetical protein